jgi:CheY-like chemotaxis protein
MTVDCVSSGQAAVDVIRKGEPRYNAIFMDHMMPGMDGIEAVRIIRNEIDSEYARTIPVIALTANAILGNEELFLNNGFQAFLTKPIDIMKLNETVNRWVRNKNTEKELGLDRESLAAERAGGEEPGNREGNPLVTEMIRTVRVKGLDMEKGLERFGGDGKSYIDSLRSYVVHTPPLLEAARTLAPAADYAITVHGVKGSSYGISAEPIGQWAEKLEHAAKEGNIALVQAETDGFIAEAEKFIAGLQRFLDMLEKKQDKPRKAAPDPALLEKIRDAAENYDVGGLESGMEELEQYCYESDADLASWLREQIDKSEFEEIQIRLTPYREELCLFVEA